MMESATTLDFDDLRRMEAAWVELCEGNKKWITFVDPFGADSNNMRYQVWQWISCRLEDAFQLGRRAEIQKRRVGTSTNSGIMATPKPPFCFGCKFLPISKDAKYCRKGILFGKKKFSCSYKKAAS